MLKSGTLSIFHERNEITSTSRSFSNTIVNGYEATMDTTQCKIVDAYCTLKLNGGQLSLSFEIGTCHLCSYSVGLSFL